MYLMLLAETGLAGLLSFLCIFAALFGLGITVLRSSRDGWTTGFAAGYLAGLVGLAFLGNTLIVFAVSRVAGPFWIVTALLVRLACLRNDDESAR